LDEGRSTPVGNGPITREQYTMGADHCEWHPDDTGGSDTQAERNSTQSYNQLAQRHRIGTRGILMRRQPSSRDASSAMTTGAPG
jgi:hypothetical protein